jgi:acetyl esterase/lipase
MVFVLIDSSPLQTTPFKKISSDLLNRYITISTRQPRCRYNLIFSLTSQHWILLLSLQTPKRSMSRSSSWARKHRSGGRYTFRPSIILHRHLMNTQVGAEKYRQMRWNGETAFPKPAVVDSGKDIKLPSRDAGREIPCRVFTPDSGSPKAVFMHIHGGGWVLQTEHYQDLMLNWIAQNCQLTVISVGYRLAPEDPYPKGNDDCEDAANWLVDHAQEQYGAPLAFMGGDSAGGHLSTVTCFRLLKSKPSFAFKGLVLNFGAFNLAGFLPHVHHFDQPLILTGDIMDQFISLPARLVGVIY